MVDWLRRCTVGPVAKGLACGCDRVKGCFSVLSSQQLCRLDCQYLSCLQHTTCIYVAVCINDQMSTFGKREPNSHWHENTDNATIE